METVKTWQKVTIAVLALALVGVIAAAAVHARDAKMMSSYEPNGAGITETSESAEYHEPVVIDETTKAPVVVQQRVPSAKEIEKELQKQFKKQYGHRSNTPNEFFNLNYDVDGSSVHIIPIHIWYQNGKMYADSYVVNTTPNTVTNIRVNDYELSNSEGLFAQDEFGLLNPNTTLAPGQYTICRFVFPEGNFAETDLTNGVHFYAQTHWDNV